MKRSGLLLLLTTALLYPSSARAAEAEYDVVVYGGVPCGIAASIAAAREGASVLLIEPTKHVGGLSTSGINTAESEHMLKWMIGGIAQEYYLRLGKHYGTNQPEYYFESSVAAKVYEEMLKEAGVKIQYGAAVDTVNKDGSKVQSLTLTDGSVVKAKTFVDAGYEGDLMARAGIEYSIGRESKAEYGEEAAGVRFDKKIRQAATVDENGKLLPGISGWAKDLKEGDAHPGVMNYNFRFTFAKEPELQVPVPAPAHYDRSRFRILENWFVSKASRNEGVKLADLLGFYKRRNGKFEVNNKQDAIFSMGHFGGQFEYPDADYKKREAIVADHMDYTLGLLHFLATESCVPENVRTEMKSWGLHKDEFKDNGNLPYQLYVREARRMKGVYVMTQKDVQEDRRKPDSIGMGSHFIDSHHVQRLALSPTEFLNEGRIWRIGYAHEIPYRALLPKEEECTNVLVAGAASFSHVAFCTYRVESVWMIGGHAAGVAAATAAKQNVQVQKIDVPALQEKLRAQKQVVNFIPDKPERFEHGTAGPPEF